MTTTSTATIETLTASVQVLKMDNRQITIGVYRQLDFVPYLDIEPFGRVRDTQQESNGVVYVIGSAKGTGELVRAYVRDVGALAKSEEEIESLSQEVDALTLKAFKNADAMQRGYQRAKALPLIILAGAR